MRRWGLWAWRVTAAVLAAVAAVECVRALADPRAGWWYLVNSDTLNIPGFYQNVVHDGYTWRAYRPSAATFAFPDAALYFAVRPCVTRTATAVVVWQALFFASLVASAIVSGRAVVAPDRRRFVAPAVGCLTAAYLGYLALTFFHKPAVELALPVYHSGALACTFVGIALTLALIQSESSRQRSWYTAALGLLMAFAVFSDRLFAFYFLVPVGVAAVAVWRGTLWSRQGLGWILAVGVGSLLGLLALKAATPETGDALAKYWSGIPWSGVGSRAVRTADAAWRECLDGNIVVISAFLWYPLAAVTVRWRAADARPLAFYYLTTVVMLAGVTTAFLFTLASTDLVAGGADWREYSRYFLGPFGAAHFGWAALLADRIGAASRSWVKVGLAALPVAPAIGLLGAAVADPKTVARDPLDYYPAYVAAVDEACARHGARRGFAGYWQAREVTLLSRTGLRVSAVLPADHTRFGYTPHTWLSNVEALWKPPAGWDGDYGFDFVLATPHPQIRASLYSHEVVARLGEPAARTVTEAFEVLVYDRPRDEAFRGFAELDLDVQFLKYRLDPRAPRRFYALAYRPEKGSRPEGYSLSAGGPFSGVEAIAAGPYLEPRLTGLHRVRYRVTAPAGAWVDIVLVDQVARTSLVLKAAEIPPGTDGEVMLDIEVTSPMKKGSLEFRAIRSAPGPLVFHWAEFEKVP